MPEQRPNVVLAMTDQQRADFLAAEGFPADTMPFFESLFSEGVRFPGAYTSLPICVPARISLLTGRFATTHGIVGNWPGPQPRFARDLPQLLRSEGYALGLFGKNHTHHDGTDWDAWREYEHTSGPLRPDHAEQDAAFEQWMRDLGHWVADEPTPFRVDCQYPYRIVSDAIEWIDSRQRAAESQPFFALVSFAEPHAPYQAPEPYYSMFDGEIPPPIDASFLDRKNSHWHHHARVFRSFHTRLDQQIARLRSDYCGMLRLIDDQWRRLIERLRSANLFDNTIIVFLADHGDFAGDYGLVRKGVGLPQALIRIPMLWLGGPVKARSARHPALVSIVDVFPTICEAIGVPIPPGVQGRSVWPLLNGSIADEIPEDFRSIYIEHGIGGAALAADPESAPVHSSDLIVINGVPRTVFDATVVTSSGSRRAVIRGSWKLVYDPDLPAELYDLSRDPRELDNRAQDPAVASVRAELQEELSWWTVRLQDTLPVRRFRPAMPVHNWYRSSAAAHQAIYTEEIYGPSSTPTEMSHFGASVAPSTN